MKKILKNAYLLIILLVGLFSFNLNANAYVTKETENRKITATGDSYIKGTSTTTNQYWKNSKLSYYNIKIRTYKGSGDVNDSNNYTWDGNTIFWYHDEQFSPLYCLDSDLSSNHALFAERIVLSDPDGSKTHSYDIGLMYILTNGEKSKSNGKPYAATSIAIRSLTTVFNYLKNGQSVMYHTYYGMAYKWLSENEEARRNYQKIYEKFGGMLTLNELKKWEKYIFTDDDWNAAPVATQAKNLFVGALKEIADSLDDSGELKVEVNPATLVVNTEEKEDDKGTLVIKDVKYTFKLKNWTEKSKFKILSVKYDKEYQGALNPEVVKITANGSVVCDATSGSAKCDNYEYDFKTAPKGSDLTFEYTVRFSGYKTVKDGSGAVKLSCGEQPMKYNLEYGYYDPNIKGKYKDYVAVVWYGVEKRASGHQRFISIEKAKKTSEEDELIKGKIPGEISLIDSCDCTDLIKACKEEANKTHNLNGTACKELFAANCGECAELEVKCDVLHDQAACEKMAEVCDFSCNTVATTFECCDEANNELIVSEVDDHETTILGPGPDNSESNDIKVCFVTKVDNQCDANGQNCSNIEGIKDQKTNSYSLASMKGNKYCEVSCKEDYIMKMPTAKLVNAGRYFTFRAEIKGTKTCFTNTINREEYNKDVSEAQRELIAAYNNFKDWEKAKDTHKENIKGSRQVSTSPGNCHQGCNAKSQEFIVGSRTDSYTYQYFYIDSSVSEEEKTGVVRGHMGTHNGAKSRSSIFNTSNAGSTSSVACTPYDYTYNGIRYSGCSGGCNGYSCGTNYSMAEEWNTGKLSQWINEQYDSAKSRLLAAQEAYKGVIRAYNECSKWDSEIKYKPNVYYDYEEDYLNTFGLIGKMDETITKAASNSSWYCKNNVTSSGNWSEAKLNGKNYDSCSLSAGGNNYTAINYIYCDEKVCKITPEDVSDARYKKVTSDTEASYRPATLFYNVYPSGEIVINKADDNVALENKLPVSLGTRRGIYKYTVNIETLGEFYAQSGNDNLGRYVGKDTAVVDPKTLVYSCAYLVNILNTDGWVCDFDDQCDDDCISNCIGPNCEGYCDGVDCISECIGLGCIYNKDSGSSLLEKQVTLNNLFPNGTTSYNWDKSRNTKAQSTIEEIEELGNAIYDSKPILSVTIDGSTANAIKKYNDDAEKNNNGGYSNATVSCYALNGNAETACYSSFITDLLDGKYGKDIVNDSVAKDERVVGDNNTKYFTGWNRTVLSEKDMIGPSWK